jgi:hypothetical protein
MICPEHHRLMLHLSDGSGLGCPDCDLEEEE